MGMADITQNILDAHKKRKTYMLCITPDGQDFYDTLSSDDDRWPALNLLSESGPRSINSVLRVSHKEEKDVRKMCRLMHEDGYVIKRSGTSGELRG